MRVGTATGLPGGGSWPQEVSSATPAPADGGWFAAVLEFARQPGVLEGLVAVVVLGGCAYLWWQLHRLVTGARRRQALEDYLLGVEQALHGDLRAARQRLAKVLETDPENHFARLLLGTVLAEVGEPEAAHQQHAALQRSFGVDSAENELRLAESLLAAGLPEEAADVATRALARLPDHAAAHEFVYRARLQVGDFAAAAAAGRRWLELLGRTPPASACKDVAGVLVQAGLAALQQTDRSAAEAAAAAARRLAPDATALPLLEARLDRVRHGLAATVQGLLQGASAGALVVTTPDLPAPAAGLPRATFAGLVPDEHWRCPRCAAPLPGRWLACPRCRAAITPEALEPNLVQQLEAPSHTMDEVDANAAHVRRVVRTALEGAADPRADAAVLALQERGVEELLRQAWSQSEPGRERAITLLRAMGPAITPQLFAASDVLENERLLPLGQRSPAALVGRIVQGFDRTALPHVEALFASARPEHRKILIDFFLGLHDLREFQIVLERFPPLEILHRLNKADDDVLRRFLQAVPPGHFVAESLLLESAFYRDEDLLAAIPGAAHPEVLERLLVRRGPTRTVTKAAIGALGEPALADVAERLLHALGERVLGHVLAACTDPERSPAERARLGRVLQRFGAVAVGPLCDSFGPEPSAFDDHLVQILAGIGAAAVGPLARAYGHAGWLEKVSLGLVSRHTNRRVQIVRALQAIGPGAATSVLQELAAAETDDNLRLRLLQARHGQQPGGGDG